MNAIKELKELLEADEITHCQRYIIAREVTLKILPLRENPTEREAQIFLSHYKQFLRMNENTIRKLNEYYENESKIKKAKNK